MTSFYEFLPDADKAYRFLYQGGCLFFLSELPSWSIFKIFWCCLLRRTVCILTSRHLKNGKEYRLRTTQWKPWAVAIFYRKRIFLTESSLFPRESRSSILSLKKMKREAAVQRRPTKSERKNLALRFKLKLLQKKRCAILTAKSTLLGMPRLIFPA